jgi:hypothetical protein
VYLAGVGLAWAALRSATPINVWPGAPLVVSSVAASGLLAMAFASAEDTLAEHAFGWRQLAALGSGVLVVVGVVTAGLSIAEDAWSGYVEEPSRLPAFLASEVDIPGIGPFRVLVLADEGDRVAWSITDADGPSLASWGHVVADEVVADLDLRVQELLAGQDPAAAAALGSRGIRYVVVPADGLTDELGGRLGAQLDLVGQPVSDGLILRVTTWLPRWSLLPAEAADALTLGRPLPAGVTPVTLAPGDVGGAGDLLVLADPAGPDPGWAVTVDGAVVESTQLGNVHVWEVEGGPIEVARAGTTPRLTLVGLQALLVLLAVSLSLRAPRFAREERS